jgi:hypothetical protein
VQALTSISAHAHALHSLLTGDRERLGLLYVSSVGPIDAEDSEQMTVARFEAALAEAAPKERAQAVSLVGPHRDDLRLTVNDVDLHQYGSHGQQRTAALSLRLAEARYLAEATGETPVLLLDDALAELDAHRRGCLLALVSEAEQCLLAVTDADRVADVLASGATAYRIEGGSNPCLKRVQSRTHMHPLIIRASGWLVLALTAVLSGAALSGRSRLCNCRATAAQTSPYLPPSNADEPSCSPPAQRHGR